jgi:hypothetical protein
MQKQWELIQYIASTSNVLMKELQVSSSTIAFKWVIIAKVEHIKGWCEEHVGIEEEYSFH